MPRIGIFFGTDTGRTRLIAKQIAKKLGDDAAAPVNIGRATLAEFLAYDAFILGSPTLGDGELPGLSTGLSQPSWEEFLPLLAEADLSGKVAAIYGLGDQKKYPDEFVDAIGLIHDALVAAGARVVGRWPAAGYEFAGSLALDGDDFLGLALDQINQPVFTEQRLESWLAQIRPELMP
ncbi:flavodoxin [Dechloromonas denitrificans]|uniref:Flavodoxin n=1 Tax=Dechloromonas denitrificans TaxID=281362 RepID=A0A133XM50_9RHOO|nr:flavodoxin [Dechloromonas denitrificans]KXB32014.1 flavodoxin [Dechloromonas denitrificans]